MNDKVKKEIERLKKADAVDIVSEILSKEIDILKRCLLLSVLVNIVLITSTLIALFS